MRLTLDAVVSGVCAVAILRDAVLVGGGHCVCYRLCSCFVVGSGVEKKVGGKESSSEQRSE